MHVSPCLLSLALWVFAPILCETSAVWQRGGRTVTLVVQTDFSYTVNGAPGQLALMCGGVNHTTGGATPLLPPADSKPTIMQGAGPMGAYDQISQSFGVDTPGCTAGSKNTSAITISSNSGAVKTVSVVVEAIIRYYATRDTFEFMLRFPNGAIGTQATPTPVHSKGSTSWAEGTLPLASSFPMIDWRAAQHMSSGGNMLGDNFHSGSLEQYVGGMTMGPVLLYNASNSSEPAVVISPLTHHKTVFTTGRSATTGGATRQISVGISGYIAEIPQGYEQTAVLVGRRGINAAYSAWGQAMQAQGGTVRLSLERDLYSRQLHYMTDNGAYYCFCNRFNSNKPWDVPMYKTIKALQQYHQQLGLHVGLYHLDPFWHSHHSDGHCDGVTASNWSHSAFHWPQGLGEAGFPGTKWQMLYMLLAGPTFRTDLQGGNVYESEYPMEAQDLDTVVGGSGSQCCGQNSQVAASHSHVFWDNVLGEAVRDNNLNALVIDTLQVWATGFTSRINNTDDHELWLDGYLGPSGGVGTGGASKYNLPIRIDQSLPSDHMLSTARNFTAVVSARCGGDMDSGASWTQMASTGAFLSAIGVRPVMDVLWSTAVQPGNTEHISTRAHIEHELVVAVLTTGPVGFGDMVNGTNATRLNLATRADGIILKPAHSALRVDNFYGVGECANKEIWSAASSVARSPLASNDRRANSFARLDADEGLGADSSDGFWWYSILSTQITTNSNCQSIGTASLWPVSAGSEFAASRFGRPCTHGAAASSCLTEFSATSTKLAVTTGGSGSDREWLLQSLAPVLPGGWILVGEMSKYVPVSPQRLVVSQSSPTNKTAGASDAFEGAEIVSADGLTLRFDVVGAVGEAVVLTVVAPDASKNDTDVASALSGVVLVFELVIPVAGRATVTCTKSTCTYIAYVHS